MKDVKSNNTTYLYKLTVELPYLIHWLSYYKISKMETDCHKSTIFNRLKYICFAMFLMTKKSFFPTYSKICFWHRICSVNNCKVNVFRIFFSSSMKHKLLYCATTIDYFYNFNFMRFRVGSHRKSKLKPKRNSA